MRRGERKDPEKANALARSGHIPDGRVWVLEALRQVVQSMSS